MAAHLAQLHEKVAELRELRGRGARRSLVRFVPAGIRPAVVVAAHHLRLKLRLLRDAPTVVERLLLRRRVGRGELPEQALLAFEQGLVPLPLRVRQRDPHHRLRLRRENFVQHRGFRAAQHEGLQERPRRRHRRVVSERRRALRVHLLRARGFEDVLEEDGDQSPELLEVVLQRRSRQQQRGGGTNAPHRLRDERRVVLDALRLVEDEVAEVEPRGEHGLLRGEHLVRRHEDVERALDEDFFLQPRALRLGAVERHRPERGAPPLRLGDPRGEDGEGAHDEVRPRLVLRVAEVLKERQDLEGLSQAHVVAEDASARAGGVLRGEPRHALALVIPQTLVEVFSILRLVHGLRRRRLVLAPHLLLALFVRQFHEPLHLLLRDVRLVHDPRRELPRALEEVRFSRGVERLREKRDEPVPEPNDERRLANLNHPPFLLHQVVRLQPRLVIVQDALPGLERGDEAPVRGGGLRRGERRGGHPRRRRHPRGFEPPLRESGRGVLRAEENRGGVVILPVRNEFLQPRGSRAKDVEALEAVLHRALHASAGQATQPAPERHPRVLHPVHIHDRRARRRGGHDHLGQVSRAAQVRVRAVASPIGRPAARRLDPGQRAAGHRAQRAHPGVRGLALALLDPVDAPLAEPLALGHLGQAVT